MRWISVLSPTPEIGKPAPQRVSAAQRIFIKDGEHCWIVRVADIVLLESEGNYTRVHSVPFREAQLVHSESTIPRVRALVVDDEPLARTNLTVLLRKDPEIAGVRECGSDAEAVAEIRSSQPHLVFLDVQMPECDGFDVLELLRADMPPAVVFVTASDQYALRAFEAGALDYLLKPFDNARFERALNRAKERIDRPEQPRQSGSPRYQERRANFLRQAF